MKKEKIDTNLYLTDKQYFDLLKKIRKELDTDKKLSGFDCNDWGAKDMAVNFGLCTKDYATKETSYREFNKGEANSLKYTQPHHKCPFDTRDVNFSKYSGSGCFHTCRFFKKGLRDKEIIKKLYDEEIKRVKLLNKLNSI